MTKKTNLFLRNADYETIRTFKQWADEHNLSYPAALAVLVNTHILSVGDKRIVLAHVAEPAPDGPLPERRGTRAAGDERVDYERRIRDEK